MTTLSLFFVLPFVALSAWLLGTFSEHKKKSASIHALESKIRLHESRAFDLQEKLVQSQGDLELLRKNLDEEKEAKQAVSLQLNETLKKGTVTVAACLLAGLFLGGTVSWFWATSVLEAKNSRQMGQLEIAARIAEVKADLLVRQLDQLQTKYESLRKNWYQVLEEKIVAQTKLDILLDNMTMGKEGQPVLEYKNMKKNWQKQNDLKESKNDSAIFGVSFPKV